MIQGAAFRVLACFYDNDRRSFVELCKRAGYPTDLGGYYLRQLVSGGFVDKVERGQYQILPKGKQQLALYYGKRLLAPKPRLTVVIIAWQARNVIVLRRKVQPFIGIAEWPAGAVAMGEPIQTAAARIVQDRLGVQSTPEFVGFFRRTDTYADTLFDDKIFAVHTCSLPADRTIATNSKIGENVLCASDKLQLLENRSKALLDILAFAHAKNPQLVERTYELGPEDFSLRDPSDL